MNALDTPDTDLRGLWVPIVTPFASDGSLDLDSLERLATRILNDGATGLVALGTTGEPATLTHTERRLVVETCAESCRQLGSRLIVGAGTNSTQGTLDEIDHLVAGLDVTAALIVVPYYTRPSEPAIVEHFHVVADSSPIPIVAYNVPYRTGRALTAAHLLDLARHPRIVGLKQAVGGLDTDTLELLASPAHRLQVLAGDDAFITPTVLMGGAGAIAAAANVCTKTFAEMTRHALDGHLRESRALAAALLPVVTIGFSEPNPSVWKGSLAKQGVLTSGLVRRPLTPATHAVVDDHLAAIGEVERADEQPDPTSTSAPLRTPVHAIDEMTDG